MLEFASNRQVLRYLGANPGALAVITETTGTSYRRVGTMMAFSEGGRRLGSLSSGCIEDDLWDHARTALVTGQANSLRYGEGSAFFDLKLPCGGGLTVQVIPRPDPAVLAEALALGEARQPAFLSLGLTDGSLHLAADATPGPGRLVIPLLPELRFWVFGQGVEAMTFALMAHAAGYEVCLWGNPDLGDDPSRFGSLPVRIVPSFRSFTPPEPDARTAVTLFFHDHENEARLLAALLPSPAFFIGAQGSLKARQRLLYELSALDVPPEAVARLRPDFGLIPSCRDPRTLAVSVLAHVLSVADTP